MKSDNRTQAQVGGDRFRVSAQRGNYKAQSFSKEAEALKEARTQSLRLEKKDIIFSVDRVSNGKSDVIIGEFVNGSFMPGVDLGETKI